jgi:hypothetical protein
MSSDIKKLLSILDESTTAGSVASVPSKVGESPIKRSKDTVTTTEDGEQTECATDTTSSPSNFGLWKNSVSIGKEQQGKHGRKSSTGALDKTVMYPQLGESSQREQGVIDSTRSARQSSERNAGLNEPDELPSGDDKYSDLGTWHFKYDDGRVVMKNGKPLLTTSKKNAKDIVDRASKAGHTIEIVGGAPADKQLNELSSKTLASYKKKAGQSASEADKRGDFAKGHKRFKGINKATKREFDNDARGVKEGVAEGSLNEGQYEMMMRNGQVKKFIAKDDADAKRIAAGHGAKSVIKLRGGVPAGKVSEQGVAEGLNEDEYDKYEAGVMDESEAVAKMFTRLARQGRDPLDIIANRFGWGTYELDDLAQEHGFEDSAEWLNSFQGVAEAEKNPHTSTLGRALYRDLSKEKKASPQQVQRNKERWAQRQAEREQGVAEGSEITEEMIADRLKNELKLFKSGANKSISKKPADRGVQPKKSTKKASDEDK